MPIDMSCLPCCQSSSGSSSSESVFSTYGYYSSGSLNCDDTECAPGQIFPFNMVVKLRGWTNKPGCNPFGFAERECPWLNRNFIIPWDWRNVNEGRPGCWWSNGLFSDPLPAVCDTWFQTLQVAYGGDVGVWQVEVTGGLSGVTFALNTPEAVSICCPQDLRIPLHTDGDLNGFCQPGRVYISGVNCMV